jgi:DNA-binding transcriptional MerR regulator
VTETTFKLDELARAAGTSPRTVRYYVQRGLLPAPRFRGKDTAYDREHLVRLRAIRRLTEAYLPLDAIAVELGRRSIEQIERLAEGRDLPEARAGAAEPSRPRANPAGPPRAHAPTPRAFRRLEIAEGVELSIADDAPAESRRLVERILDVLNAEESSKEGHRT